MSDEGLEQIRKRHWGYDDPRGAFCHGCGESWPCEQAYLLERLERVKQELELQIDATASQTNELRELYGDLSVTRTRLEEAMKLLRIATYDGVSFANWVEEVREWLRGEPVVEEKAL